MVHQGSEVLLPVRLRARRAGEGS